MGMKGLKGGMALTALCSGLFSLSSCGGGGGEPLLGSGPGQVALTWEAPTAHEDGSPIIGTISFTAYYGTVSPLTKGNSQSIGLGNGLAYALNGLGAGTYYFAVTATDNTGNESGLSQEASKDIS